MKDNYTDNFEYKEDIECTIKTEIKLYVYIDGREFNDNGKWRHSDPVKRWYNVRDILYFREQNEHDRYSNDSYWIMDSTVMRRNGV